MLLRCCIVSADMKCPQIKEIRPCQCFPKSAQIVCAGNKIVDGLLDKIGLKLKVIQIHSNYFTFTTLPFQKLIGALLKRQHFKRYLLKIMIIWRTSANMHFKKSPSRVSSLEIMVKRHFMIPASIQMFYYYLTIRFSFNFNSIIFKFKH